MACVISLHECKPGRVSQTANGLIHLAACMRFGCPVQYVRPLVMPCQPSLLLMDLHVAFVAALQAFLPSAAQALMMRLTTDNVAI